MILVIAVAHALVFGYVAKEISKDKVENAFWWGFCLGIIGVAVVWIKMNEMKEEKTYNQKSQNKRLEQLYKLKESKAITDEEYETEKKKLLNN